MKENITKSIYLGHLGGFRTLPAGSFDSDRNIDCFYDH